ncbi:site-specific DNA-methyltransferase [Tabrizicola sp.]|uniref:site-specific DNA-methyltransferase n=1 Tax=Tabrizicola sp. TaxID=2005166 RepID=UPI0025CBCC27|nr:site-specific DNA-methyltransferase [Tabrizicola sp.]MBY0352229.1 site-specific DNA-methyltransferase [Tabrizicola sp.]
MSNFDALVAKLREIFQIDRPDLDFGVYRILNARAGEIEDYLSKRLKARVAEALAAGAAANTETLKDEIAKAEKSAQELGISADQLPKVQQLRAQLAAASAGASEHENQVFSHLLTFFSRYYDKGDFISQRRYKGDTYAIPYSGEEVVLHWANRDQYYTKSGESFSNFSFKLDDGRAVHFRLVAADTAKDNRKDNDKERRFVLATARTVTRTDDDGETFEETIQPVTEEDGALVIRFDYAPQPKGTKQETLVDQAVAAILDDEAVKARWLALTTRAPTEKNPKRTVLEKHLTTYTQKNTADYFIHKDLGGFLRRELDFYIKNEVMNLDDVQGAEAFAAIEKNLRMIQCLRAIALDLITFLASIENFQKKLWLKKKFVVAAQYCVTLDRVPEALYPSIAANTAQWAQWHDLGMRASAAPGTVEDLNAAPFLMVDTALFDAGFRADLLKAIPDLDASLDGLLVHGDNFQALTLLTDTMREKVQCIYIDPPYNTGSDGFAYKDGLKSSSWLSLLDSRLALAKGVMADTGVIFSSIDKRERDNLKCVMSQTFGAENFVEDLIWVQDTVSNNAPEYSTNHEYVQVFCKAKSALKKIPNMFRGTRPGYAEVTELVSILAKDFPPSTDIKKALNELYKEQREQHLAFCEEQGIDAAEAKKIDPWKGIYPYKHIEYRTKDGRLVPDDEARSLGAQAWVWREVEPSMPSAKQSPTTRDPNDPNYRFYRPPHPKTGRPCTPPKRGWSFPYKPLDGRASFTEYCADDRLYFKDDDTAIPQQKYFLHEVESVVATSVFRQYADGEPRLQSLFNESNLVDNPKPPNLVERFIQQTCQDNSLVLDFFAGSGTTAEAVISESRKIKARRRYLLVEQGEYFNTVLKPRVQKVVYSSDWSEGKPAAPETGISHAFKVLKIEGYEDALNNLDLKRSDAQASLLEGFSADKRDDYLMRYMLDVEAKGSLLSVQDFRKPFDYTLKVAVDSAGAWEERKVDLVETFNYLIGLTVRSIDIQLKQGFVTVEGWLPTGEKTLILWRDCEKIGYEELTRLCDKLAINPADSEYDVVYINGDHNIPSVVETTEEEGSVIKKLMLRQIEPAFLDAMFNVDDV